MACNPALMVDPFGLRSDVFDNGARPIDNTPRVSPIIPVNSNARYIILDQMMYADQAAFHQEIRDRMEAEAEGDTDEISDATISFIALLTIYSNGNESSVSNGSGTMAGQGVDYIYDGASISSETIANGLDNNRVIRYSNVKQKIIGSSVDIGDKTLKKLVKKENHSLYVLENFGDGAIALWRFLAEGTLKVEDQGHEWSLTEFKTNDGMVKSRITSTFNTHTTGYMLGPELYSPANTKLVYWISIHSHPNSLNVMSTGDYDTLDNFRSYYSDAQMNAFNKGHYKEAYNYINNLRK